MRVYIAGPIKGNDSARECFALAAKMLRDLGKYEVVNPFELNVSAIEADAGYAAYMRADLKALVGCDAIHLLRGWENSAGARLEFQVAQMCGLLVTYQCALGLSLHP